VSSASGLRRPEDDAVDYLRGRRRDVVPEFTVTTLAWARAAMKNSAFVGIALSWSATISHFGVAAGGSTVVASPSARKPIEFRHWCLYSPAQRTAVPVSDWVDENVKNRD
jgi:hypothetical protein